MKAEDVLGLMVPVTFVFFFVTEKLFARRTYPPIRWWNLIGFGCLILTGVITTVLPSMLPESVTRYHLIDGTRLGLVGGVLVGYPLTALGAVTRVYTNLGVVDVKPHGFALSRFQFAVQPSSQGFLDLLTTFHKNALNFSCSFFLA